MNKGGTEPVGDHLVCTTLLVSATQHLGLVCIHIVELLGPGISMSQGHFLHQSTQRSKELRHISTSH
jgi:hypothetical protein